jgi:Uma2 family endonuclease
MATDRVVLTYADYAALPDDGKRYEIHEGELSATPAPGTRHQMVSANLGDVLRAHVEQRGSGLVLYAPLDVILSETTIVQPDLVYVDPGRQPIVSRRGIEGAPTLVVEIISAGTPRIDRVTKMQRYARHAVPFYWIVDPDARVIEAYALDDGAYRPALRASGAGSVSLPPFADLALVPDALWPTAP